MIDASVLKQEELAVFSLRALYKRYGYLPYKMGKFEEYELYLRNKDFLISDRIITFNDTNGRLMALKPDVTLSIIKSSEDIPGVKQKVCYNENVYRVSERTHRFKEILQTGLECIGDIDLYDIYEVISLAAQSLSLIADSFALEISHQGILTAVLARMCSDEEFINQALHHIAGKNSHDLRRLCGEKDIPEMQSARLIRLLGARGSRREVLAALRPCCKAEELAPLEALSQLLDNSLYSDKILFDFSVVNDMNYYNGFVFKGFLNGISEGVLAGGQYDKLMQRMGRRSGAVGFALYLDLLEQLEKSRSDYDVDVLLLYDDNTPGDATAGKVQQLIAAGRSVSAQKAVPEKLRFRELTDMRGEGALC